MEKKLKKLVTSIFSERIGHMLNGQLERISQINNKYATARVKMTPMVRRALLVLRLYLLFLVGVLAYKFYTMVA